MSAFSDCIESLYSSVSLDWVPREPITIGACLGILTTPLTTLEGMLKDCSAVSYLLVLLPELRVL